jgi:thioredoxin 1
MSQHVIDITDATFAQEVGSSPIPVLVDFWAPWCGPCRMVGPVVEDLAGEMAGKVKFCKVNVDDNQQIAQKFGIMSIPALLVFKGGSVVNQHVGALPKAALKSMLEKSL